MIFRINTVIDENVLNNAGSNLDILLANTRDLVQSIIDGEEYTGSAKWAGMTADQATQFLPQIIALQNKLTDTTVSIIMSRVDRDIKKAIQLCRVHREDLAERLFSETKPALTQEAIEYQLRTKLGVVRRFINTLDGLNQYTYIPVTINSANYKSAIPTNTLKLLRIDQRNVLLADLRILEKDIELAQSSKDISIFKPNIV
jgi:hypothetical protein